MDAVLSIQDPDREWRFVSMKGDQVQDATEYGRHRYYFDHFDRMKAREKPVSDNSGTATYAAWRKL